ncbi:hypothetical protein HNP84_009829 [Thermocatellispora tengchongensis]|uniref:Uncharacterized protein n=1 Tax=Thermocatellispora tengchongensis TaxID=1073253 RepID=A0A840PF63_9ACTN|nr:hypothetical protein [Thermocatellispora tengchongensis]MBB5140064.1 hypothetical protein [Thermocatellispora tengchongensis]
MDADMSGARHAPLHQDAETRFLITMSEWVSQELVAKGSVRVWVDRPENRRLFQEVARRVGELLGRRVVSYARGREILIMEEELIDSSSEDEDPCPTSEGVG